VGDFRAVPLLTEEARWAALPDVAQMMMYQDILSYLPDDLLVKVDRATMAVSLESRAPFLDHRIVEFAARLPADMKLRAGEGKWILKSALYRHVARELVDRPKQGFGPPIGSWLRGPLRDWGEALLDERKLRGQGYLRPAPVQRLWSQLQNGGTHATSVLWAILAFQAWLEHSSVTSSAAYHEPSVR